MKQKAIKKLNNETYEALKHIKGITRKTTFDEAIDIVKEQGFEFKAILEVRGEVNERYNVVVAQVTNKEGEVVHTFEQNADEAMVNAVTGTDNLQALYEFLLSGVPAFITPKEKKEKAPKAEKTPKAEKEPNPELEKLVKERMKTAVKISNYKKKGKDITALEAKRAEINAQIKKIRGVE